MLRLGHSDHADSNNTVVIGRVVVVDFRLPPLVLTTGVCGRFGLHKGRCTSLQGRFLLSRLYSVGVLVEAKITKNRALVPGVVVAGSEANSYGSGSKYNFS